MWRSHQRISWLVLTSVAVLRLMAGENHGQVLFNGLPVPGAAVVAVREGKQLVTATDAQGVYSFADLADGQWSIRVEMLGFLSAEQEVAVGADARPKRWDLKLLSLAQIEVRARAHVEAQPTVFVAPPASQPDAEAKPTQDLSERAADGLLINGSVNNGAASLFSQAAAFGNMRNAGKGLYNGGIGLTFDNSAFDANQFSVTGQESPKPEYNRLTGLVTFGGPLRIPHVLQNGPFFFVGYQWTRNRDASIVPALVPDAAERSGDFPQQIVDPTTGLPFARNQIPATRVSAQARALLNFYPLPNFASGSGYNYQVPLVSATHQDALQSRSVKNVGARDQFSGRFAFQSTRTDDPS